MRLIRFVAVACMVAVSVASLGCGDTATTVTKADTSAETSSEMSTTDAEAATKGTTPVSLAISGMA